MRGPVPDPRSTAAHTGPVLVAPAMNTRMWRNPATQANVETLVARGFELVGPDAGELAEGEVGAGRMTEPDEIADAVVFLASDLARAITGHCLDVNGGEFHH